MIRLLLYIILFGTFYLPAKSQTNLRLILNTDKQLDSVLIIHWTDKEVFRDRFRDTINIDFKKTSGIDFYHFNYYNKNVNYYTPLYLDTGNLILSFRIKDDKLHVDSVSGSSFYPLYKTWKFSYDSVRQLNDTFALSTFLLDTYKQHLSDAFSFYIGSLYVDLFKNQVINLYPLPPLIKSQPDDIKRSFMYGRMHERLMGFLQNDTVNIAKYQMIDRKNKAVTVRKNPNSFTLLEFWFVGCPPCQIDHLRITALLPQLKARNIEFIGISSDVNYDRWNNYLKKNSYNWPNYKILNRQENIITQLGINIMPTYILLDKNQKIVHVTNLLDDMLAHLEMGNQ